MQNKNKDRGMIKWQPFASLPEHMEYINKVVNSKNKKKKKISNDKLQEMNKIVENSIINSTKLVLFLYKKGDFYEKVCVPLEYDYENRMLIIMNENKRKERIPILEIIDIKEF